MANKDAQEFPYHVEMPIPPSGLGKRLDIIAAWLNTSMGPDWRSHSHLERGEHRARYMFHTLTAATLFDSAIQNECV